MLSEGKLQDLLQPGAAALGFEVIAVELSGRGHVSLVRVYIDGPNGVTVDDCARVSHQLSAILDVEDPIPDRYTLEVSSPGVDRPLTRRSHFEAVLGCRVRVKTSSPIDGRRRFKGTLCGIDGDCLFVEVDGQSCEIPLESVVRARLVPDDMLVAKH